MGALTVGAEDAAEAGAEALGIAADGGGAASVGAGVSPHFPQETAEKAAARATSKGHPEARLDSTTGVSLRAFRARSSQKNILKSPT